MAHKLATIAVIGLAASAVCVGAAAAIGGGSLGDGFDALDLFDDKPRCEVVAGATAGNRTLDWDNSDHIGLAVNGRASYAPGSDDKVHVSGDPQVLAHLRIDDGDIEMDCRGWRNRTKDLTFVFPGREFRTFSLAGGGSLFLDRLNQSRLKIEIAGSGTVKANGKIDDVKMEIAGSGDGDFAQLVARDAKFEIAGSGTLRAKGKIDDLKIEIAGSGRADFGLVETRTARVDIGGHGNVDIAPSEFAKIEIGGSGDVYLHSNPKQLETEIGGSGQIHKVAAAGG